jgi:hypothetical protein
MTDTATETKKNNRAPYGFKLEFPQTFTLRDLRKAKHHKVKYITLYMRVKKALTNGEIAITGQKEPTTKRRGAKELVYSRVLAAAPVETVAAVTDTNPF